MNLAHLPRRLGDCCRESDGQLLDAYLSGSQPAFRHLTDRHGPLVFGVCQRILRHQQDAEDAFQAVFLVLARRAADVWPREAVGSWLYGVAYRIALKARVQRTRQRRRELPLEDASASCEPRLEPDVAEVVFQTIRKLPEVYRAAVVACDLQGLSRKNAARQLNWSEGTLSSRLARARQLLAERLLKTGVALPVAGLAAALGTLSPLRAGLLESAMRVISSPSEIPAAVATLTQGVVTGLFAHKLKNVALAMLMTFTISYGAYCADGTDEPATSPAPEKATRSPAKTQDPMVDAKPRAKPIEIERRGKPLMITTDDNEILDKLSKPSTSAQLDDPFKVIRLRKIVWAEGAARTITEILNGPQEDRDRHGIFPPGPAAFVGRVGVIAETSTNSIIVIKSSPIDLLTIEKLLGDQIEACEYLSEKDINGPRADRVLFYGGYVSLVRGNLSKAEMDFSTLVETHRDSPLRPQALAYAIQAKNSNNPIASRTFELRLRSMIFSDGKPPELSFYMNRDDREFQDSGSAGSKPVASAVQVLIGSKVGKIADLSPGDTVTVQLSPDNKSITRIELNLKTMKARLDALDQEAETLRKRIQQLEKGK